MKAKKLSFKTSISLSLNNISEQLQEKNYKFSLLENSMTIAKVKDYSEVEDVIKEQVCLAFKVKKPGKVLKLNQFNDSLYVRFKKVI